MHLLVVHQASLRPETPNPNPPRPAPPQPAPPRPAPPRSEVLRYTVTQQLPRVGDATAGFPATYLSTHPPGRPLARWPKPQAQSPTHPPTHLSASHSRSLSVHTSSQSCLASSTLTTNSSTSSWGVAPRRALSGADTAVALRGSCSAGREGEGGARRGGGGEGQPEMCVGLGGAGPGPSAGEHAGGSLPHVGMACRSNISMLLLLRRRRRRRLFARWDTVARAM